MQEVALIGGALRRGYALLYSVILVSAWLPSRPNPAGASPMPHIPLGQVILALLLYTAARLRCPRFCCGDTIRTYAIEHGIELDSGTYHAQLRRS